jgi:hypothetical protein
MFHVFTLRECIYFDAVLLNRNITWQNIWMRMKTIESVFDSITTRAKYLGIITDVAKKYFAAMEKYILGMNPAEHARMAAQIKTADDVVNALKNRGTDVKLSTLYEVWENFSRADAFSGDFITLCKNPEYAKASLAEMSSGEHTNMRADINRALIIMDKYLAAARDDDEIFDYALKITKTNHGEYFKFLYENHSPNKFVMELIRRLLPIVVGDQHLYISELVQKQKMEILSAARVNVGTWSVGDGVYQPDGVQVTPNPLQGHERAIFRYNCTPDTVSMHPRDLFKTLDLRWEDSMTIDENFRNAAKRGRSIVVLTRLHGTPIEFNFRGVLDKEFANKFPLKPYGGLNKNFIARYKTTSVLTRASAEAPGIRLLSHIVDNKFPVGFVASRQNWTVIETIDGENYRGLGCTLTNISLTERTNEMTKNLTEVGIRTNFIPGSRIFGLIMGASTLPTEYNSVHCENIDLRARGMFDPLAPSNISRYAAHESAVAASEPIKNAVIGRLEDWIRLRAESVKSNRDWQQLFVSEEFITAVNEAISHVLVKGSLIDRLKSPEYTITQIAKISAVVARFLKSITRAGETLQDRMFSEYSRADLNAQIITNFLGVMKKAADLMDSDKVWTGHELTLKEYIIAY